MTYLDWAASAPPDPRAVDEAREASLLLYANPSSPHAGGRQAGEALSRARASVASRLGVEPDEIAFTSGGTESNTAVLLTLLDRLRLGPEQSRKARIVVTGIEHASVYEQARALEGFGFACTAVRPDKDGIVPSSSLAEALDADTALVAVMLVNNETGAVQRLAEISAAVREAGARAGRRILLHTDAVQALGKIPLLLPDLGVDTASFSGHKLGAPRGVGCLYVRAGLSPAFLARGGGQEKGRRPGTENLPGACALARAARDRADSLAGDSARARGLASRLVHGVRAIPGGVVFPEARRDGEDPRYSPWIVSIGFPPVPGEVVVRLAEARGYLVGTGSACSSKKKDRTRVMEAMGLTAETALCAVRVSTGPATTEADIDGLLDVLSREVPPVRAMSRGAGR
jgi:cysteine desulfurase